MYASSDSSSSSGDDLLEEINENWRRHSALCLQFAQANDYSSSSSCCCGDDLLEEINEIWRGHRVFCLQFSQVNDYEVSQRLMGVWTEVFSDPLFLEEIAIEFDRKDTGSI